LQVWAGSIFEALVRVSAVLMHPLRGGQATRSRGRGGFRLRSDDWGFHFRGRGGCCFGFLLVAVSICDVFVPAHRTAGSFLQLQNSRRRTGDVLPTFDRLASRQTGAVAAVTGPGILPCPVERQTGDGQEASHEQAETQLHLLQISCRNRTVKRDGRNRRYSSGPDSSCVQVREN